MSDLQVSNTFLTGATVDADQFNTNYSDIVTYVNNRNSASSTWDAFSVSSASNVPCIANNSTGAQDIAQFKDNGTVVGEIFDGGIISWPYQDYAFGTALGFNVLAGSIAKWAPVSTNQIVITQTHSSMDTSPKFTVQSVGKYLVSFQCRVQTGTGSAFGMLLYKNGVAISKAIGPVTSAGGFQTCQFMDIVSLAAGDYLEIYIDPLATTGITFGGLGGHYFIVVKVA